jgi:apolipoprotein N-acyltransferase
LTHRLRLKLGFKAGHVPRWAIALGGGVLMACAPEPLNGWGLAWVALVPLWVLVVSAAAATPQGRSPLLYAGLWGVGYHGIAISWITGLHPLTWLGMSWGASVAVTAFCWAFIALWGTATTVLWAWGMRWLVGQTGKREASIWGRVLVGTALWCSLEWLLTLTPLNWTSLSYTQSPGNLWAVHLGQLSGPLTLTAAIVACNGMLAEAWIHRSAASSLTARRGASRALLTAAALLLLSTHLLGAWLYSRPLQESAPPLRLGIVQGNVPTRIKLSEEGLRRAIAGYIDGYETLVGQGADAVLTPEGAIPIIWSPAQPLSRAMEAAIVRQGVPAWIGTFVREDRTYTQSLLAIDGQGRIVGRYNKIKLVPLGEYIPLQGLLGGIINRLSPIEAVMVPGREDQRFETPLGRAIASICYESAYPGYFRAQAAAGGQFILTASNLDPYSEALMKQHQAHDLMRAVETDRWAIRATNTGYSGFIDPHGRVVWRSQPLTYAAHTELIHPRQTQTLYVRVGNWLTPSLLGGAMLVLGQALKRNDLRLRQR